MYTYTSTKSSIFSKFSVSIFLKFSIPGLQDLTSSAALLVIHIDFSIIETFKPYSDLYGVPPGADQCGPVYKCTSYKSVSEQK